MTTFPGSPRLINGAIVDLHLLNPLASVIVFQYNPDTQTPTLHIKGRMRRGYSYKGEEQ
jgi:hypothetical protein